MGGLKIFYTCEQRERERERERERDWDNKCNSLAPFTGFIHTTVEARF